MSYGPPVQLSQTSSPVVRETKLGKIALQGTYHKNQGQLICGTNFFWFGGKTFLKKCGFWLQTSYSRKILKIPLRWLNDVQHFSCNWYRNVTVTQQIELHNKLTVCAHQCL